MYHYKIIEINPPMFRKNKYIKTVCRPYPPLYASLIMSGYSNPHHFLGIVDTPVSCKNTVIIDGVWYYGKGEIRRGANASFKTWLNPQKFKKARAVFVKREKKLIAATGVNFAAYAHAYETYMPALLLLFIADNLITEHIKKLLRKKLSPKKTAALMEQLNAPLENNFHRQEEYELLRTADLKQHVKKYEWIFSRYGQVNPYTLKQAGDRLKQIDRAVLLKKWRKLKKTTKAAIAYAKTIVGKKNMHAIELLQFYVYYRTQRTDIMNKSSYLFAPQLKKIGAEKGIEYEEILHCTKDEIMRGCPPKAIIRERIKEHVILMETGIIRCVAGKEAMHVKNLFQTFKNDATRRSINTIKGRAAYPGETQGTVKIIKTEKDFSKMEEGDILVTAMTTTQMMPVIKDAGAIITDEGGITSHAAIISRELKIPCIMSTKTSTQILKDGDRVRVDAKKGVITKLT